MHVALKCWWTPNRLCAAKNPQFYCYEILTLKFSFSNENIDPKHTIGFCSKLVSQKSKSIAHAQNLFNADDLNFMRAISFSGGRWGCSASLCHSDLSRKKEVNVCGICNMRKAWKPSQDWNCTVKFRFAGLWKPFRRSSLWVTIPVAAPSSPSCR